MYPVLRQSRLQHYMRLTVKRLLLLLSVKYFELNFQRRSNAAAMSVAGASRCPLQFRVARKFAENAHDVTGVVTPVVPVRRRSFPQINITLTSSSRKVVKKYRRLRERWRENRQETLTPSPLPTLPPTSQSYSPPHIFTARPPPQVVRTNFPRVRLLLPSSGSRLSSQHSTDQSFDPLPSPASPTFYAIRSKPLPRFNLDKLRARTCHQRRLVVSPAHLEACRAKRVPILELTSYFKPRSFLKLSFINLVYSSNFRL